MSPQPKGKSLFFLLVLNNPFIHYYKNIDNDDKEPVRSNFCCRKSGSDSEQGGKKISGEFVGNLNNDGEEETLLKDTALLDKISLFSSGDAPSDFMKVIDIVLRLEKRGFSVLPENMVSKTITGMPKEDLSGHGIKANQFKGFSINWNRLIVSPDFKELYIRVHCDVECMLQFAECHGIRLRTHEMSNMGGMMVPFSFDRDRELSKSVEDNRALFEKEKEEESEKRKKYKGDMNTKDIYASVRIDSDEEDGGRTKQGKQRGFVLSVPDKMRLLERIVREGWEYGGCGIQVSEMRNKGVLVRHFFPLHNKTYMAAYGIDRWGSLGALLRWHPWYQSTSDVKAYFGEDISLYFLWLKSYTLFLPFIAIPGIIATIVPYIVPERTSLVNGVYGVLCVIWGAIWNAKWAGLEQSFSTRFRQDEHLKQESVRDEYRPSKEVEISRKDIFTLHFGVPLTLLRRPDGQLVDQYYSYYKRCFTRYLFSYPCIIILTSIMVVVLSLLTWWRFKYLDNNLVKYGSSILSVVTSVVFGQLFQNLVGLCNYLENNRTETDEQHEIVVKSFFFNFFSYYFFIFTLILWPSDATDEQRLNEIKVQMLIICVVKPFVQNLQEILLPFLMTRIRRRRDKYGGYFGAIISILRCQSVTATDDGDNNMTEAERLGRDLWKEAQKQPYTSTSGDYLEIALQYGYMIMFSATFPIAPFCAFVYNTLEIRIDSYKLTHSMQRPIAKPAKSIGGWGVIFIFLSGCSFITNAYIIALVSSMVSRMDLPNTIEVKYKAFVILQYIFIVVGALFYSWASSTPVYVSRSEAKFRILNDEEERRQVLKRKKKGMIK